MFWLVSTIIAVVYSWFVILDVDEMLPAWTRIVALVASYYAAGVIMVTAFWLAWKLAT